MNIPMTLSYLRPDEEYTLTGSSMEGLTWLSDTNPPTAEEIAAAYPLAQAAADKAATDRTVAMRKIAEASGLTPDELAALGF